VDPDRDGDGRGVGAGRSSKPRRPPNDNPARRYNRPPDAKLLDVPGLLIMLGIAVAGLVLALILTGHLL
jgi:hypothetical protein